MPELAKESEIWQLPIGFVARSNSSMTLEEQKDYYINSIRPMSEVFLFVLKFP